MNWRAAGKWLSDIWKAFNDITGVALKLLLVLLIVALLYDYFNKNIVIRPIVVPKVLSDDGISDVVAADALRQRIYAIMQSASLNSKARMPVALSAEEPDIAVPTTGVSVNTIFELLADVLPNSARTVISGDFAADEGQLRLVILANGRKVYDSKLQKVDPANLVHETDALINAGAENVVEDIRPELAALDLDRKGQTTKADALLYKKINASDLPYAELVDSHLFRGMFLREERKLDDACDEFAKSLELSPSNHVAYRYLSMLLVDEANLTVSQPEKKAALNLATAEAQKAIILSPVSDSWDYYALGNSFFADHDWPAADGAYSQAIALRPGNGLAQEALGNVEENEKFLDKALSAFDAATTADASSHDSFDLADAWDDRGELQWWKVQTAAARAEARQDFMQAWSAKPGLARTYVDLGYVSYDQGRDDDAIGDFTAGMRGDAPSAAYDNARKAVQDETSAPSNKAARLALSILDGSNPCAIGQSATVALAGHTVLRNLIGERCRMLHSSSSSSDPTYRICRADSGGTWLLPQATFATLVQIDRAKDPWLLPGAILLYARGFVDKMGDPWMLVAATFLAIGAVLILVLRHCFYSSRKPGG